MRALFFPWVLFIYFLKIVIYIDQAREKCYNLDFKQHVFNREISELCYDRIFNAT